MTQHDEDAAIGQLVRQRREAKTKQAAVQQKSQEMGRFLSFAAQVLQNGGSVIPTPNEGEVRFLGAGTAHADGKFPTLAEVMALIGEAEALRNEIQELEPRLKQLGL